MYIFNFFLITLDKYSEYLEQQLNTFKSSNNYLYNGRFTENFNYVLNLIEEFNMYIKSFVTKPCLKTAQDLYEFYNKKYINLSTLEWQDDYVADNVRSHFAWRNFIATSKQNNLINEEYLLEISEQDRLFNNYLLSLIIQYKQENKLNFKSIKYDQWLLNISLLIIAEFKQALCDSIYKDNLVGFINQADNPITGPGRRCLGITAYCVEQALAKDHIEITDSALVDSTQAKRIEKYQHASGNFESIFIILPTKLSFKTANSASKLISCKLKEKLLPASQDDSSFGLGICFLPNNIYSIGHIMGIAKNKYNYFFIDSNFGIFKFPVDEANKFFEFIDWFLYKTKYCHMYNKFFVTHIPDYAKEGFVFPALPIQLQSPYIIPDEDQSELESDTIINNIRDGLNTLYATTSSLIFSIGLKNPHKKLLSFVKGYRSFGY